MNMPIAPSAVVKHKIAWRKCKNFDMDATVHVISSHNPWRPGSRAWKLFELVLRVKPVTTIRDIITDAMAAGYADDTDVMSHLRWLYTWGDFLEINGQRYFPKQEPLPGEDKDVA
jgi:hypothetical protein